MRLINKRNESNWQKLVKIKLEVDFEVKVDQDQTLGYEGGRKPILYLPLMWLLTVWVIFKKRILRITPRINALLFDGLSLPCRRVKEGAATWRALDLIYNYESKKNSWISKYWFKIQNAQAVRNRFRLVRRELAEMIENVGRKNGEVLLLSLASGSAQAILEAMVMAKERLSDTRTKIRVIFIDLDKTAIEYSKKLAVELGFEEDETEFILGGLERGVRKFVEGGIRPDIVEMVGFLDYRPELKATRLVRDIFNLLPVHGLFLTANICSNPERYFLKWVINWDLIYRAPQELGRILVEGGFNPSNISIICEPLELYAVAKCQKDELSDS